MTHDRKTSEQPAFQARIRHYAEILNPLFDTSGLMRIDRLFEFICTLVRAGGMRDAEWDPWYESQATLDDLGNLATLELPPNLFPDPARTRVRLSLLSYCHLTEMDFPYSLIANLLRLRAGKKYDISPFLDLAVPKKRKKKSGFQYVRPSSVRQKLARIKEIAHEAGSLDIIDALESIHDRVIRNAVYHSDFALADGELRLLSDVHLSKDHSHYTPVIEWDHLSELFSNTFAFYTALFLLYDRSTKSFTDFVGMILPFDGHYKGLLQLIFDERNAVTGFCVYWPNGSCSEFRRVKSESRGVNIVFDPDRSINFMVGLYASSPGDFSPLVERAREPSYSESPGATIRLHWPTDLKPYELER